MGEKWHWNYGEGTICACTDNAHMGPWMNEEQANALEQERDTYRKLAELQHAALDAALYDLEGQMHTTSKGKVREALVAYNEAQQSIQKQGELGEQGSDV